MARIHVTGPNGDEASQGWFESEDAEVFEQGAPPRVKRTRGLFSQGGAREAAQQLILTGDGRWVVRYDFGEDLGLPVQYHYVDEQKASSWLCENGHADAASTLLPEPERGPGRPEIGGRVQVRLGDLLPAVDAYAERLGVNRAEAVRQLVAKALGSS